MMQTFFRRKTATVPLLAAALLWFATSAHAVQYGFDNISNNSPANATAGEAQLFVEVTEAGSQALFTFRNLGPAASSIADIYFDDRDPRVLLNIASILDGVDGDGVDFSLGAVPPNLPGWNTISPAFQVTAGLSSDSDSPVSSNGVNPNETLGLLFNLQTGGSFQDVLDQLQNGSLRIGIHVQAFGNGGSESFVNTPGGGPTPTPEPGTWVLMGTGLVGLLGYGWRRRQHQAA